jgi:hypothetical protein
MDNMPSDMIDTILNKLNSTSYKLYHMTNTTLWEAYTDKCDIAMSRAIKCLNKREHSQTRMIINTNTVDIYQVNTYINDPMGVSTEYINHIVRQYNAPTDIQNTRLYTFCEYANATHTQNIILRSKVDAPTCVYRLLSRQFSDPILLGLYMQYIDRRCSSCVGWPHRKFTDWLQTLTTDGQCL